LIRNRTTTTTWAEADPWDPRRAAPASACIYGVACTPGHCVHVLLRHGPRAIYRPMHGTMGWLAVAWCDGRRDLAAAVTYVRTCACGARRRASDPISPPTPRDPWPDRPTPSDAWYCCHVAAVAVCIHYAYASVLGKFSSPARDLVLFV
jgi:hypothetical protein